MRNCARACCCMVMMFAAAGLAADRAEVLGWGYNQYGQAYGSPGMENVEYVAVAAGGNHTLAVTTNGTLLGWGLNDVGQTDCPAGSNFTAVCAGNYFSLALSNNNVIGWGDNSQGQLDGPSNQQYVTIAAGGQHALGLTEDGRVIAWGSNESGQTDVPPAEQFRMISAGQYHSIAMRADGTLLAWGSDTDGQTNCLPGNNYSAIAAGGYHNVALRANGTLVAWGNNDYGQTNCPAGNDYVGIAAGLNNSLALRADGSVVCWGANSDGQSDAPDGYLFTGIAAGYYHSVALRVAGLTCRFSADRVIGLYTLPVQFSGQTSSTNALNIYFSWDFQNDGVIDAQGFGLNAPSFFYTTGIYSVLMFTSNQVGESAFYFRTNFITVNAHGVAAGFSANLLTGAAPLSVQFTDKSQFVPHYWHWDFNNDGGSDSSLRNPLYAFATAGLYSVRLTVSNNFGTGSGVSYDVLTRTNYIKVYPNVIAAFNASKTRVFTNEPVQFTDVSSNAPNAWYWDFDNDGTVDSTQPNPIYAYATAGYKTVRLLVSNEYSAATLVKTRMLAVITGGLTNHVWVNGNSTPPYSTWPTAATNIQDALEMSVPGGVVLVSNGVYTSGGYEWHGTNVFVITNAIALVGCGNNVVIDGWAAQRGGYLAAGRLENLMVCNGAAPGSNAYGNGGGLWCTDSARVDRCRVLNSSATLGGGVFADKGATLYSTLIMSNNAVQGGGLALVSNATSYNCTIMDNTASSNGGGVDSLAGFLWNAIVWNNTAPSGANYRVTGTNAFSYSCTAPQPGGVSNMVAAPALLSGYRLPPDSPCVGRGYTFGWAWSAQDLAGDPRVHGSAVDLGAYAALPTVIADFRVSTTRVLANMPVQFTDWSSNSPSAWYWDFDNDSSVESTQQNPAYAYTTAGYKSVRLLVSNEYSAATLVKPRVLAVISGGLTNHVWPNGSSTPPYDSWAAAATNIQDAIELSVPGGVVLISNGVYSSAGYAGGGTNVFVITNAIALVGCGTVVIDGRASMRGGYLAGGRVAQITVCNGVAGGSSESGRGGGLYCTAGAEVDRCRVLSNQAQHGGGVYAGPGVTLYSTLIASNSAPVGGGIALVTNATSYNCTIVDNAASVTAGGADSSAAFLWNAIVWNNMAPSGANYRVAGTNAFSYSCTSPHPGGVSNIMANPAFLAGYELPPESPCAEQGYTFGWAWTARDLAGDARVHGNTIDQGAYEAVPEPAALALLLLLAGSLRLTGLRF